MGAAGNVGGKVADLLLARGEPTRVLEHARPLEALAARGAEVVHGDAASVDDLARLFAGADAALVLLPDQVGREDFVAARSASAGAIGEALRSTSVGHVVALSSVGVDRPDVPGVPAALRELEARLSELADANVLVLRSTSYMDYNLAAVPLMQEQGVNGSVIEPDRPIPWVATRDVAGVAAARLAERGFRGHGVEWLIGPEDLTMRQVTAAIGRRLGLPDVPYVQFPPEALKDGLRQGGFSEEAADMLVAMQLGVNEGRFVAGEERTPENTGPTRLDDFLDEALGPQPL
jgi:uncharacterized protein YbjT (DUF2867 family)